MHEEQILELIQAGLRELTQMLSFIPIWLLQDLETTKYNDNNHRVPVHLELASHPHWGEMQISPSASKSGQPETRWGSHQGSRPQFLNTAHNSSRSR